MTESKNGKLFLVPVTLGPSDPELVIPQPVLEITRNLKYFIAENAKSARKYLKGIGVSPAEVNVMEIDKHDPQIDFETYFGPLRSGFDTGLLSEAGMPAIADPGSSFVRQAHSENIRVVPLPGPSSILLALAASGLSGQQFCFHGYLPKEIEKRKELLMKLERESSQRKQAQIFIETPYRNNPLLQEFVDSLNNTTRLCVGVDLTLPSESIQTMSVKQWKAGKLPDLKDRPAIFIFQGA